MTKAITQYNTTAKSLHWLSALLVISLFILGLWMVDLNYYSAWYKVAPHWHKSLGLCLFAATLFRLLWQISTKKPPLEGRLWEKYTAKIVHKSLYLLLFSLFISGYMISTADGRSIAVFNWFSLPGFGSFIENQEDIAGAVHFYLACATLSLAAIHALAALKHHFINKDNTLHKML
ncbi:MAG: cytochrome b [Psychromonas sp.]|nr:cytochrome b [Psychromonas sp.]